MSSGNNSDSKASFHIDKEKWWDILSRFINVLRVNIFIVDAKGTMILPPEERRYGGRLLSDQGLKFSLFKRSAINIEEFEDQGDYFEKVHNFDLRSVAFPVCINKSQVIAYMVISPIIFNRRLLVEEYKSQCADLGVNFDDLMDEINGLRVVSHIMIKSIIDLLEEIVQDNIEYGQIEKELQDIKLKKEEISEGVKSAAEDIVSSVNKDELLISLLDLALNMTMVESGSIMVLDPETNELAVKISRGVEGMHTKNIRQKLGEGIAGTAAKEKSAFLIRGCEADKKIRPFLKKPEIKESLVMPLIVRDRVYGVLNLSTKGSKGHISENIKNLKCLSRLVSTAI